MPLLTGFKLHTELYVRVFFGGVLGGGVGFWYFYLVFFARVFFLLLVGFFLFVFSYFMSTTYSNVL